MSACVIPREGLLPLCWVTPLEMDIIMKKPPIVPSEAKTYFDELLNGAPGKDGGLTEMLNYTKEQIAVEKKYQEKRETIHNLQDPLQKSQASSVIQDLYTTQLREDQVFLETTISRIERLSTYTIMNNAYPQLVNELENQQQWNGFLSAALSAGIDYQEHRESIKAGKVLAKKIAKDAKKLAELLEEFEHLNLDNSPAEFSSVWHLFQVISKDEGLYKFKNLGELLNPNIPERYMELTRGDSLPGRRRKKAGLVYEVMKDRVDRELTAINKTITGGDHDTPYPWRAAPELPILLKTLAAEADQFKPAQSGMVGAVMVKRESLYRNAFIRSFGYLLTEEHEIPLTKELMKAMAIFSDVVINDPEDPVSYQHIEAVFEKKRPK